MEKYCIFCGQPLERGTCTNARCVVNEEIADDKPQPVPFKKPISLLEHRRQLKKTEEAGNDNMMWPQHPTADDPYSNESGNPYGEKEIEEAPSGMGEFEGEKCNSPRRIPSGGRIEGYRSAPSEVRASAIRSTPKKTSNGEENRKAHSIGVTENSVSRFFFFIRDYYAEPGKVVAAAARKRDMGISVVLLLLSVMLSVLGTLLFGYVHLENFFIPWIVCGMVTPILAYGTSFLFGRLFVIISAKSEDRRIDRAKRKPTFKELFPTVAVSSMIPNLLLLLSCLLSPMDKSFGLFQLFALLITVTWVVSLIFSLFTVYGGEFSLGGLLLTIGFCFLAFLSMRTLWVWFLTGEFKFTLYIPLSVFFS